MATLEDRASQLHHLIKQYGQQWRMPKGMRLGNESCNITSGAGGFYLHEDDGEIQWSKELRLPFELKIKQVYGLMYHPQVEVVGTYKIADGKATLFGVEIRSYVLGPEGYPGDAICFDNKLRQTSAKSGTNPDVHLYVREVARAADTPEISLRVNEHVFRIAKEVSLDTLLTTLNTKAKGFVS